MVCYQTLGEGKRNGEERLVKGYKVTFGGGIHSDLCYIVG
jgi:hypothetical protein